MPSTIPASQGASKEKRSDLQCICLRKCSQSLKYVCAQCQEYSKHKEKYHHCWDSHASQQRHCIFFIEDQVLVNSGKDGCCTVVLLNAHLIDVVGCQKLLCVSFKHFSPQQPHQHRASEYIKSRAWLKKGQTSWHLTQEDGQRLKM